MQYSPTHFSLLKNLEAKNHYPSPQVFNHYQDISGKSTEFNKYKNDRMMYELSMPMLYVAQIHNLNHVFGYNIKQDAIDGVLGKLKGRYFDAFLAILRILLNPNKETRFLFNLMKSNHIEMKHFMIES